MEIFSSTTNRDFECNICSESEPNEPVVTLCGHIYCWPCIYLWLQTSSPPSDHDHDHDQDQVFCPICKAKISDTSLVPLYGRGSCTTSTRCGPHQRGLGLVPRRPPPPKLDISGPTINSFSLAPPVLLANVRSESEATSYSRQLSSSWVFGNTDTVFLFPSYPEAGYRSPRMRRREIRSARSLNRLSLFLLCCLIMCLLFF